MQDISHDLRTPISALRSQFEGILDGVLDMTPARIEKNLGEIQRVERLISQFSELVMLEEPDMKIKEETVDIAELVEHVIDRFEATIQSKQIAPELNIEQCSTIGDRELLTRAVSNIVSNAVTYTNEGGSITVYVSEGTHRTPDREDAGQPCNGTGSVSLPYEKNRSTSEEEAIIIQVRNSGALIPPEELNKVFDRLYRGEYARKTKGTGLGLNITKRIIELHGGTIHLGSDADRGTVVRICLPKHS